jgi:malonyl CoA-acyl carrier protein transacylase/NADP-dependent 3-hydroxy acid dehydrogenase YdfG
MRADLVITGGVDTMNDVTMFTCFSRTPALSPTGDCRPFSASADGTMLGEGVALFALKRLADAERDGDTVYGVIRGVGASSDGRGGAIYAPRPEGQVRALRRAYEAAGYGPETVGLVEAHGTGTSAGDTAEFTALREVFDASGRPDRQWCALGSVKSQIGHTKAAAGAAGLLKAVLALHHKVLPPTIKVDRPNPALDVDGSPFYLNTLARPWVHPAEGPDAHPRRASVSSFGFGGTNFHVTLEEYLPGPGTAARPARRMASAPTELVLLSAGSVAQLRDRADRLDLRRALADIARESQTGFGYGDEVRLALVASDTDDLAAKLADALSRIESDRPSAQVHYATGPAPAGRLGFLFPGQGAQYVGMGGDLALHLPHARRAWDRAARPDLGDAAPHRVVFPPPSFTDAGRAAQEARLTSTEQAQPALAVHSLALLEVLGAIGLHPDCVAGHSFGELAALHAAGAYDADTLVRLARRRGELMRDAPEPGGMLAVSATREWLDDAVAGRPDVWLANHNAPRQVVLAGTGPALDSVAAGLAAAGVAATRLNTATAFHSPLVAAAQKPLLEYLNGIAVHAPRLQVFGNADATAYPPDPQEVRLRLAGQLASPVAFVDVVEAMYAAGVRVFVEVGAGAALTGLVGQILAGRPHLAVDLDRKGRHGLTRLQDGLGRLAVAGVTMDLAALWDDPPAPARPAPAASRTAIRLDGGNYGRPYPPQAGARDAVPLPDIAAPPVPAVIPGPIAPATPVPPTAAMPVPPTLSALPDVSVPPTLPVLPDVSVPTATPWGAGPSMPLVPPVLDDGWLRVIDEAQRQTAEAHSAFQRAMTDSHLAYLRMAETTMAGLLGTADQQISKPPSQVPKGLPPQSRPSGLGPAARFDDTVPPAMAAPAYPTPLDASAPWAPHDAPTLPLPHDARAPRAAHDAPAARAPHDAPEPPAALDAASVGSLLLSVVAERTGYPVDLLTVDMELDTDLGIDSIKKVEILSAVRERIGDLSGSQLGDLPTLRTLREIAERLTRPASATATPPAETAHVMPAAQTAHVMPPAETAHVMPPADAAPVTPSAVVPVMPPAEAVPVMPPDDAVPVMPRDDAVTVMPPASVVAVSAPVEAAPAPTRGTAAGAPTLPGTAAFSIAVVNRTVEPGRWAVREVAAAPSGLSVVGLADQPLVVTDDGLGVAPLVVAGLARHGIRAAVVAQVPPGAAGVILLDGLRRVASVEDAEAVQLAALRAARAVAARMEADGGVFVTVQDTGGGAARAWLGGLAALARTAAKEWPRAAVKAIDCVADAGRPEGVAEAIVAELLTGGGAGTVGLRADGTRTVPDLVPSPVGVSVPRIGPRSVVVATGGARGVTAAALRMLAGRYRPRMVLLGRTPLVAEPEGLSAATDEPSLVRLLAGRHPGTPAEVGARARRVLAVREIRETLDAIEGCGASVRYAAVDVRDAAALAGVLAGVRAEWGPVTAVVHAAGVVADARLAAKTDDQFARVFGTKVAGLHALLDATVDDPLDVLCVFSSVAAVFGNPGQADYAMANEVLDTVLTRERARRPGCLVRAIAWGPWEGGMVTPDLAERFRAGGVPLIDPAAGARAFLDELAGPADDVVVVRSMDAPAPSLAAEVTVTGRAFPYLADHRIAGVAVLPVATVVDWFAAVARAWRPPAGQLVLRDLRVLDKVALPRLDGGGHRFLVHGRQGGPALGLELRDEAGRAHYRARASIEVVSTSDGWRAPDGLERVSDPYDGAALFHGASLRALRGAPGVGPLGAEAVVVGSGALGWDGSPGEVDVAALDGVLQLAVLWARHAGAGVTLPMGIGECRVYRRGLLFAESRCVVRAVRVDESGAVCDAALLDPDGTTRLELAGIQLVRRP